MKDEPDIIKELREREKLGKLKNYSNNTYDILDTKEDYNETNNGTMHVFEKPLKEIGNNINFDEIQEKYSG